MERFIKELVERYGQDATEIMQKRAARETKKIEHLKEEAVESLVHRQAHACDR